MSAVSTLSVLSIPVRRSFVLFTLITEQHLLTLMLRLRYSLTLTNRMDEKEAMAREIDGV